MTPSNGSIVCDCAVGPGQPTPIRRVCWGSTAAENAAVKARSLGQLVTWWIEAFDVGAWSYHPKSVGWGSAQCVYLTSSSRSDPPETSTASTACPLPLA